MLFLSLIETSFAFPKLDRHSHSFIFDLPLSVGDFHFLGPFLAFCIDSNIFSLFLTKNPHLPLMWDVIHVRVLFLKEIFYQAQNGIAIIYFKYCEKSEQK